MRCDTSKLKIRQSYVTFIRRRDLEITADGIESCWVEIIREKEKNIVSNKLGKQNFFDL